MKNPDTIRLDIILDAFKAYDVNDDDPDLLVAAFRRIADDIDASGCDDGFIAQLFENIAQRIENFI